MGNTKSQAQNARRSSAMDGYRHNGQRCRCKNEDAHYDQDDSSNDGAESNDRAESSDDNGNVVASAPLCYCPPAQGLPTLKSSNKKSTAKKPTDEDTSTEESSLEESTSYSYPEFPPSSCGIYYVQCPMCCQIYPSCCQSCPNCGHTPRPPGNGEVQMPASAYCPCCRQEAPKANGLQNMCTPCPCACVCPPCFCCVCPDENTTDQTQCIQLPPTCCHCCPPPLIYICENPNSYDCKHNKNKSSIKKKVTHCCCNMDASRDEPTERRCECDNEGQRSVSLTESEEAVSKTRKQSTRKTRYKEERRQCSCADQKYASSSRKVERSPIYGKAHCPCGCEVDIQNITFQLPVCNDEDDD